MQDRLNEQEGVPSVFNPPPSRPLQVNTADHRVYSYIVSRPQPRVSLQVFFFLFVITFLLWRVISVKLLLMLDRWPFSAHLSLVNGV